MTAENIWIIGGTSGIGKAVAQQYITDGHKVAISGASAESTENVAAAINATPAVCDITNRETLQQAREQLSRDWQVINRIICFAAAYEPMPMTTLNMPVVDKIISVNLQGAFNVTDMAMQYFKATTQGRYRRQFAFTASISGYTGLPNSQPYGATKAGVINLMETLHAECANQYPDIDIKMINPGFVKTKLTDKNDFKMPFIIEPEKAADYVIKGLNKKGFEVHFPKKMTYGLKFVSVLPYWLKQPLVKKFN